LSTGSKEPEVISKFMRVSGHLACELPSRDPFCRLADLNHLLESPLEEGEGMLFTGKIRLLISERQNHFVCIFG
jgi:hypothetical protein